MHRTAAEPTASAECQQESSPSPAAGSWLVAAALTAVYAAAIALQTSRPLWFDELLTYNISKTSGLPGVLRLVERWDLNPPLLHLLAHATLQVTNGPPAAIRIPSILAFYGAGLLLFWYFSRRGARILAPLSVLALWGSPAFASASEARPYALLCFWCAALLVTWDAAHGRHRLRWATALLVSNVGLLLSHVFAPFTLLPFLAAEWVRSRQARRWDPMIWAALLLPSGLILAYVPFYRNYKTLTLFPPVSQASLLTGAAFYGHTSGRFLLLALAGVAVGLLLRRWRPGSIDLPLGRPEWTLGAGFALAPLVINLALMHDHAPFWPRYGITSQVIFSMFAAVSLAAWLHRRNGSLRAAIWAVAAVVIAERVVAPAVERIVWPTLPDAAILQTIRPDLPLVDAGGLTFVEMAQRERGPLLARLYYLEDRQAAESIAHTSLFNDLDAFQQAFSLPGQLAPYRRFVQEHAHFLVLGTAQSREEWLLTKLESDGAQIRLLGSYRLPYRDRDLYEVALPATAARASLAPGKNPAASASGKAKSYSASIILCWSSAVSPL